MQKVEQSNLGHGIKSAIIGSAIGYGAKYALPLTSQEMDADYRRIISTINKNSDQAKKEFLEEIKNLPEKSLAQDAYIKSTKSMVKYKICAYNHELKKIRPALPFVVAGGIAGLLTSFVSKTFRTEVN